jgi:uncharacterized protein
MSPVLIQSSATHTTNHQPRVVHSLRGRVRIHVPHCLDEDGEFAAWVGWLAGVISASANALTGNILILYDPRQTTEQALLAEMRGYNADRTTTARGDPASGTLAPPPLTQGRLLAETVDPNDSEPGNGVVYATGLRRLIYQAAGWTSVGLAVVGAITPGIPTVPFVVLAAYFFVRSSPESHAWLLRSRWFGPILRDWEQYHAVKLHLKYGAVFLILLAMAVTLLVGLPMWILLAIYACEIIGLAIVLQLPVVEQVAALPELAV